MTTPTVEDAPTATGRRFAWSMVGISVVALGVRVWSVLTYYRQLPLGFTDNFYYSQQANFLADGHGFSDPFHWQETGELIASADHPPLYSLYLAVWSLLGFRDATDHRLASSLVGVATVIVLGLVARRIAGDRAGLVAAGIAALYPPLWIADGTIVAEALYATTMGLVLLAALRAIDAPELRSFALLGGAIGLAALTRSEGLSLLVLLVVPVLLLLQLTWRKRVRLAVVAGMTAGLLIAPWFARNLAHFAEPVPLSYGAGFVMHIGNCEETYHGPMFGYWHIDCAYPGPLLPDKSIAEVQARRAALGYISDNLDRVPAVVAARVGRLWHLYRVEQGISFDKFFERRGQFPSEAAVPAFYGVGVAAAAGAWALRRHRATLVALLALLASATLAAAMAFGITRYRIAGDVGLVVLAAVGVDAVLRRLARCRDHTAAPGPEAEDP